jgi:hypothetical protein
MVIRFSGERKRRGERGVKRGECGTVSGRGGDARVASALEAVAAAALGWLHPEEEGSRAGPTRQ